MCGLHGLWICAVVQELNVRIRQRAFLRLVQKGLLYGQRETSIWTGYGMDHGALF
jgi:hypothetical protein